MKKQERATIWRIPVYLPYVQPKLTAGALAEAEKKLGVPLPKAYVELLQTQNGGYIRFSGLGGLNTVIYGIGPYFPNLTDNDWSVYDADTALELEGLVPFDGDGHWYICLDYRQDKENPRVTYIDMESDMEERMADSFDDYLEQLALDIDGSFVLETEQPLADLVSQLQDILQTDWTDPDARGNGYPVYRTKWKESWIWVSANQAPKGFVRPDDERYEELKDAMNGTALRYPELPATALLLKVADDEVKETLQHTLSQQGITLRRLKDFI